MWYKRSAVPNSDYVKNALVENARIKISTTFVSA